MVPILAHPTQLVHLRADNATSNERDSLKYYALTNRTTSQLNPSPQHLLCIKPGPPLGFKTIFSAASLTATINSTLLRYSNITKLLGSTTVIVLPTNSGRLATRNSSHRSSTRKDTSQRALLSAQLPSHSHSINRSLSHSAAALAA